MRSKIVLISSIGKAVEYRSSGSASTGIRYLARPSRSAPRRSVSGAPWPAKKMTTVSSFRAERTRNVPSAHRMFRRVGLCSALFGQQDDVIGLEAARPRQRAVDGFRVGDRVAQP